MSPRYKYSDEDLKKSIKDYYERTGDKSGAGFNNDPDTPSQVCVNRRFGSWHNALEECGVPNNSIECRTCGNRYLDIGKHWHRSDECSLRPLTDKQRNIIVGLLLGDGSLNYSKGNACVAVEMSSERYLEWLEDELDWLCSSVKIKHTAEEQKERVKEHVMESFREAEGFLPTYLLLTRRHPELNKYESWYGGENKVFPNDIKLTPEMARNWYCGDGSLEQVKGTNPQANIACINEMNDREKILGYFENTPFNPNYTNRLIRFSVEETPEFLEWMGNAPPGFEYKWAKNYDDYKRLKGIFYSHE